MSEHILSVTLEFPESQVERILKAANEMWVDEDNPITVEEVFNTPALKMFLIAELEACTDEIVESSWEACANDWLSGIEGHRSK